MADAKITCRPNRKSDAETTPSPSASHDCSRLNMDSKSELSVSARPLAVILCQRWSDAGTGFRARRAAGGYSGRALTVTVLSFVFVYFKEI
jgi:hypothetical protein